MTGDTQWTCPYILKVFCSIYYYGGDSSVSNVSVWSSELSILPIFSTYSVTEPPWKPASGPQNVIGGPSVSSHVSFSSNNNMIVIGGVMPLKERYNLTDEEPLAYSYNYELGRWNSFSLPSGNHLNRQGAASTTTETGLTFVNNH